jgi:hypothetical protein
MIRWLTLEKNNLPALSKQMITGVMNMIKAWSAGTTKSQQTLAFFMSSRWNQAEQTR